MTQQKKVDPGWVRFYLKGDSAGDWWLTGLSDQNYKDLQNLAKSDVIFGDDKKSIQRIAKKAMKLRKQKQKRYNLYHISVKGKQIWTTISSNKVRIQKTENTAKMYLKDGKFPIAEAKIQNGKIKGFYITSYGINMHKHWMYKKYK